MFLCLILLDFFMNKGNITFDGNQYNRYNTTRQHSVFYVRRTLHACSRICVFKTGIDQNEKDGYIKYQGKAESSNIGKKLFDSFPNGPIFTFCADASLVNIIHTVFQNKGVDFFHRTEQTQFGEPENTKKGIPQQIKCDQKCRDVY